MSSELEQIYKGMLTNQLPLVIKKASYPSLKSLSSYITNLTKRVNFFKTWLELEPQEQQQEVKINENC